MMNINSISPFLIEEGTYEIRIGSSTQLIFKLQKVNLNKCLELLCKLY